MLSEPGHAPPIRVTTLRAAIAHQKFTALAVVALFLGGGAAVVQLTPTAYEAQAELHVTATQSSPGLDANPGLLDRYFAGQATTTRVLQMAARKVGRPLDSGFVNSIYARPGQMGTVLVAAYASDANAAAANANAVASSVIDVYQADQASRKDDSRQYLESQLAQLHPGTGAYLDTYERLQSEYVALSSSLDSIYVLAPAVPPSTPVRPDRSRYLLVALLTGICAGLLAALVRERVDDRVRTAEDVARAAATRLVVSIDGRAPAERRARLLSIAARKLGARGKTLLVVAARKEERAGEVAEALVRAATVNGDPAVLYRANLGTRSPALAARAIQAGSWGLTLVAVPAPAESPMAVSLARLADGAVIVASAGKTRFSQVAGAAAALRAAGVPTVAAVVTPAAPLPRLLEVGR